jgi:hypothetical protein
MQTSTAVEITYDNVIDFTLYKYAKAKLDEAINAFYYFEDDAVEDIIDQAIQRFDFQLTDPEHTALEKRSNAAKWIWSKPSIRAKILEEVNGLRN